VSQGAAKAATWKRSSRESRPNAGPTFSGGGERVKRHGENDELLAVVGYLDTSVVLMDLLSREAQPEAIERALAAVEKASKDQAAATARIPLLTVVLNTATPLLGESSVVQQRQRNNGDDAAPHR
jgi:hypothetical protein